MKDELIKKVDFLEIKNLKIQTLPNHQNYLNDQYRNLPTIILKKELIIEKSISDDKTKQISKKNNHAK